MLLYYQSLNKWGKYWNKLRRSYTMEKKKNVSMAVIKRMPKYHRYLKEVDEK